MIPDDYVALLTSAHRDKPKLKQTLIETITPLIQIANALEQLPERYDIDTAVGDQLQTIALWVGAPRTVPNVIPLPYFGFEGQPAALPFGEVGDPSIGGFWRESGVSGNYGAVLDTETLRKVVKAQIFKNSCKGLLDDAHTIISMITDKAFKIKDLLNMRVELTFLEDVDVQTLELSRLMFPRPAGVELTIKEP